MTEAPIYDGQTLRLSRPLDVTGHRYISMRGVDIAAEEAFEGHALVIMDRGACLNLSRATINTAYARRAPFGGRLTQEQVDGTNALFAAIKQQCERICTRIGITLGS